MTLGQAMMAHNICALLSSQLGSEITLLSKSSLKKIGALKKSKRMTVS